MNERRFLSLDLLFGHDVSATMYRYLLNAGMTADEYTWYMAQRDLRSHCIMGTDYYITNEHVLRTDGRSIGAGMSTATTSSPASITTAIACR